MSDLTDLNTANARRRTVLMFVQDVIRETRGQCTNYEARQAFQDAINAIDAAANWEFLIATRLINTHAAVSDGTVSINSGTTTATLTGGTWATALSPWGEYREIKFGDRGMPYKVAQVTSTTTLDLKTSLSGTTANHIVDGSYVLFQARYPLPSDCEPGRDLTLRGPDWLGSLPKRERYIYERSTMSSMGATIPEYYTDDEYDDTNGSGTIRIEPYPTTAYEIQLTYYRKFIVPDSSGSIVMIPEVFERAPILAAAANILRKKNGAGWQVMRQEAGDLLRQMYNRYAVSPAYEGKINPDDPDMMMDQLFGIDNQLFTRGIV